MRSLQELALVAIEQLAAGERLILCTISASKGATPRGRGTRMLVGRGGPLAGTVGGGAVEYQAVLEAKRRLLSGQEGSEAYALRPGAAGDIGMVCGGDLRIAFQLFTKKEIPTLRRIAVVENERSDLLLLQDFSRLSGKALFLSDELQSLDFPGKQELLERLARKEDGLLRLKAESGEAARQHLPSVRHSAGGSQQASAAEAQNADGQQRLNAETEQDALFRLPGSEEKHADIFAERIGIPGFVHIFGGGHVAQALVPCLAAIDFACIVYEDRPEFLKAERFPGAYDVCRIDFENIRASLRLESEDYALIMTRGHAYDFILQAQVLDSPVRYIGVIGSRRKRQIIEKKLQELGFEEGDLARILSPVGLDIAAETPAEIAVSIAAQMIRVRNLKPEGVCESL